MDDSDRNDLLKEQQRSLPVYCLFVTPQKVQLLPPTTLDKNIYAEASGKPSSAPWGVRFRRVGHSLGIRQFSLNFSWCQGWNLRPCVCYVTAAR